VQLFLKQKSVEPLNWFGNISTKSTGCREHSILEFLDIPKQESNELDMVSFFLWLTMIGKDKSADCDFPIPHNMVGNHEIRENQYSPQYTASTSNRKHAPTHLVLNNFLTQSSNDKSVSVQDLPSKIFSGESERNTHANFLYVYFFFSYYLCLTPFRLKKMNYPGESDRFYYEIHEFLPQKVSF